MYHNQVYETQYHISIRTSHKIPEENNKEDEKWSIECE